MKAFLLASILLIALCFSSSARAGEIECDVCNYIVKAVETYVDNNATESQILSFLERDCELLGVASWVSVCKGAVGTFGPEIINLVIEDQPAAVVCKEVGLCNSTMNLLPKYDSSDAVSGDIECDLCQFAVKEIEKLIAANQTTTEIMNGLTDACNDFPVKSWVGACIDVVKQYGPSLINYVDNEPAAQACSVITLCPPSDPKSHKWF